MVWHTPPSLPESLPAMDPPAHPSIGPSHPAQKCFLVRMDWVKEGGTRISRQMSPQLLSSPSLSLSEIRFDGWPGME